MRVRKMSPELPAAKGPNFTGRAAQKIKPFPQG